MRRIISRPVILLLAAPLWARADATVLVNAIPSGAAFYGVTAVGMPFHDAESANPKDIGAGLSHAVASMIPAATQNGITFICLISSPGDNPVEAFIEPANAVLRLRRKNSTLSVVFFRGGATPTLPMIYTAGSPDPKRPNVSAQVKKIAVPPGVTTAGWVYFNLTRVQETADKAGAPEIFLKIGGTGASSPIAIPGMKEPMMVYEDAATLTEAWYTKR